MADEFELEYLNTVTVNELNDYWQSINFTKNMINNGKELQIFHIDCECDTLSTSLTDIAHPVVGAGDGIVASNTVTKTVFIRSSNAADASKTCRIFVQKADETLGWVTLTTDATDGTTPVESDPFYYVFTAEGIDAAAGNLIIDDDGESTTDYFTLTLGASPKLGFFCVPKGYRGGFVAATAFLTDSPGNTTSGVSFTLGESFGCSLSLGNGHEDMGEYKHQIAEGVKIRFQGRYKTAIITSELHSYFAIWAI